MGGPELSDGGKTAFMLKLRPEIVAALESRRLVLGFNSANELSSVILNAFSEVPAERIFSALASVRAQRPTRNPRQPQESAR